MNQVSWLIHEDSRRQPYFLKLERIGHSAALEQLQDIFIAILEIDRQYFLNDELCIELADYIRERLERCRELVDKETFIKCVDWIRYRGEFYRMEFLGIEAYEQVENLDRVFSKLFRIKKKLKID